MNRLAARLHKGKAPDETQVKIFSSSPTRSVASEPSSLPLTDARNLEDPVPIELTPSPLADSAGEVFSDMPNTASSTGDDSSNATPVLLATAPSPATTPTGLSTPQTTTPSRSTTTSSSQTTAHLPHIPSTPALGFEKKQASRLGWKSIARTIGTSSVFHPIKSAVSAVEEAIEIMGEASLNRDRYATLHVELERRYQDLAELFGGPIAPSMTSNIENLARDFNREISHLQMTGNRATARSGLINADVILDCSRRVDKLSERLTQSTNMNMLKVAELERLLEKLTHSSAAWYSSVESAGRRKKCTPQTRSRVLSDIRKWVYYGEEQMHWMNGMAGTGKTAIAYSLSEELDHDHKLVASFFCSRQIPSCRDVDLILPTISHQLARFSLPFRCALYSMLERNPDVHTRQFSEQFRALIAEPLRQVQKAIPEGLVVVIDGLDECERQDAVGLVLDILFSEGASLPIKFFISSRPVPEIANRMQNTRNKGATLEFRLHDLERWIVREDIETYLKTELDFMSLSAADLDTLANQCGVLFIYAARTVQYVKAGSPDRSSDRLKEVLDMPALSVSDNEDTIDSMYTTILSEAFDNKRLKETERRNMMHVLHTIVCTQEPLTPAVIATLPYIPNEELVHATLAQLSSVLHYSGYDGAVTTLHPSFLDYMYDENRSGQFHCQRPGSNIEKISTSMHSSEVVKILVNHGCPDITADIVLAQCSTNPIAYGGFGDIYRGKLRRGTDVAIKCARILVDHGPTGNKTLKRAARELYVWSKSTHENVLVLLGLATFRGQIAMISPWMEHGTLVSYIKKYPDCDRCLLSAQIAEGLSHLHALEIIHGDLKGQNVLVAEDATAKLTDFGNVISNHNSLKFTTTTTKSNFSLRWTAPELLLGRGIYSIEADVYALGMTILETHTGDVPYPEKSDPAVMGAVMVKMEPPSRPEWCIPSRSDHGDKLWNILTQSWAHEPDERPSVTEMGDLQLKLVTRDGLKQYGVLHESRVPALSSPLFLRPIFLVPVLLCSILFLLTWFNLVFM